jgi:hypothetical protein
MTLGYHPKESWKAARGANVYDTRYVSRSSVHKLMKKKKRSYEAAVRDALQAIPPPPSNTMVKWDASLSADQYYQEASKAIAQTEVRLQTFRRCEFPDSWHHSEISNYNTAHILLREAKHQLFENSDGLARLFDRDNWSEARPSLSVSAVINVQENLKIVWEPPRPALSGNKSGFTFEFFEECYFHTGAYWFCRPAAELLWFRNVPLTWRKDQDHPAVRCIIYAIHTRYQQILRDVSHQMQVLEATRFGPLAQVAGP